ncbi:MAG: FtsX-like permease family protein [Kordiimonadaceae bacterium]|nr:FtsX-like permease family protein [Kordiimonadaceae bacterium]MBO6568255.1 FtsX-like permease family protein [Kordiimonadaceae bacterium]MBO6964015.1 FtsX-like permease family protein [Kordiimonadaceae bacterium]
MGLFSQIWTVVVMNVRSLPQRLWMSLAAVLAVSVVVAVLLSFLAMSNGFASTLGGTGSDSVAIVTRSGSQSELNSVIGRDSVNIVSTAPGIAQDENGQPIYSAELYVVVDGIKKSSGTEVNIPMRGISPEGFALRDRVDVVAGRMFEPGTNEILVGQGVIDQFAGFDLGQEVTFGKTRWSVVGVFSTGGTAFESELWADARLVQDLFNRGNSFQTMRIRLSEPGNVEGISELIENDPRLILDVDTESDYFSSQGEALQGIVFFGWGVSIIMGLGALAGALNTMYTSVASRAGEIATLRAIGFSNVSAFFGTLAESVVLSIIGGVIGALVSYTFMDGLTTATMGPGFTQVVFTFEMSPELFKNGIQLALIIGLVGGFFPAWRAARLPVVTAFRKVA